MRLLPALALALAAPAAAQEPEPATPASVVAAAPASDWRPIEPDELLVMDLAPDREGKPRRVIIQLMPPPFSQGWVENVRTLARARWWDGTSVYRVVDNWVAQWGDGEDDDAKAKPLPAGIASPQVDYWVSADALSRQNDVLAKLSPGDLAARLDSERIALISIDGTQTAQTTQGWHERDSYASWVEFWNGWPLANEQTVHWANDAGELFSSEDAADGQELHRVVDTSYFWPIHCYGHVGVARDTMTTGTGAELYAVIGHAPRQLDRNIAVVGRVIEGIEHLSTLPRGKGDAGVYDDPALRVPIVSVRLGNEVPEFPQPRFEYLASESASFAEYVRVRANRNDAFYKVPAGGIDVCNVQVPIRRIPSE